MPTLTDHSTRPPDTSANLTIPILIAVVTGLAIAGDILAVRSLHYGCKPLIMGILLCYGGARLLPWLRVGMVFALLGDVLLMIQEINLFVYGLGAFLLMQLCYCRAFWQSRSGFTLQWVWMGVFVVYVSGFLCLLYPALMGNPAWQGLWWPVVGYALALGMMGLLSVGRLGSRGGGTVVVGALLFIASDSMIAVDKFLTSLPAAAWLIMGTYAPAQYLIVRGMLLGTTKAPPSQLAESPAASGWYNQR